MHRVTLILLASLLIAISGEPTTAGEDEIWLTRAGYYRVSYKSQLQPLTINRIHSWVFHVETAGGDAVTNAVVTVTGGMPNHNHGLPTEPRMTQSSAEGDYVIEGMRFHMAGLWEITVVIEVDGRRDTVVIPLTL